MMQRFLICVLLSAGLVTCSNNDDTTSGGSGYSCTALKTQYAGGGTTSSANILPVSLGGGYPNEITVSVTICVPGTTTCQTIPNVLLDTGSNGLRLFSCAVQLSLPTQTVNGGTLAECVTYADTTSHWGSVQLADVQLGGEKASNVPIHIVDPRFGSVPDICTNLEMDPSLTGYNGIVGVGLLTQDCGDTCALSSDNQAYYSCTTAGCNETAVPTSQQVTNPVSMMPVDYNGIILALPSVAQSGSQSAGGTVTLGLNTSSGNNTVPSTVKVYKSDDNVEFNTVFNNQTYSTSFIDSGSNALYFPATAQTPACTIEGAVFYCPTSVATLSGTQQGVNGSPSTPTSVSFAITNASTLLSSGNSVFSTLSGQMTGDFDWGLPFFMGRTVYVGIEGQSGGANIGINGPYWAY